MMRRNSLKEHHGILQIIYCRIITTIPETATANELSFTRARFIPEEEVFFPIEF